MAALGLRTALEAIAAVTSQREFAERALRLASERYRERLGTIVELSEAQAARARAAEDVQTQLRYQIGHRRCSCIHSSRMHIMKERVTLTLDPQVLHRAKRIAHVRKTSVSGLIEDFVRSAPLSAEEGRVPFARKWAGQFRVKSTTKKGPAAGGIESSSRTSRSVRVLLDTDILRDPHEEMSNNRTIPAGEFFHPTWRILSGGVDESERAPSVTFPPARANYRMNEWVGSVGRVLSRDGDDSLRDLMIEYQQGSAPAAEALVERLSPMLLRFFQSADWSRNRAEDLLQECWVRLHSARHTYSADHRLLPWVFAIARHTRVDGFRRYRRRAREVSIEETTEKAVAAPPSQSDGDFERLLARLPESQREVILMLKVVGLTLEEVARATSSTVGAVKQKAHRAYETLRRCVAEEPRTEA